MSGFDGLRSAVGRTLRAFNFAGLTEEFDCDVFRVLIKRDERLDLEEPNPFLVVAFVAVDLGGEMLHYFLGRSEIACFNGAGARYKARRRRHPLEASEPSTLSSLRCRAEVPRLILANERKPSCKIAARSLRWLRAEASYKALSGEPQE